MAELMRLINVNGKFCAQTHKTKNNKINRKLPAVLRFGTKRNGKFTNCATHGSGILLLLLIYKN